MDYSILAKLEAEAGQSRKLQEAVRLLRAIHGRIQEAKPAAEKPQEEEQVQDVQQLAAQVVYLDKKITRLREKVKRKALEATNGDPGAPTGVDVHTASAAELQRELAALRAAKAKREAEAAVAPSASPRSPSSPSQPKGAARPPERTKQEADSSGNQKAMKRRLEKLQMQMKDLAAEKEAADASTKKVRELSEAVEQRLRETVLTRESERIKLEAEQELLRRRLEEQEKTMADLQGPAVEPRELAALEERLAEVEQKLAAARERARKESVLDKETATWDPCSGTSSPRHTPQMLSQAAPSAAPTAPPTPGRANPQAPAWPPPLGSAEYENLLQSRADAEQDLERALEELERARAADAERVKKLEDELTRVRNEAFQAEHQLRKDLADAAERRCGELAEEAKAMKEAQEQERQGKQAAFEAARRELEELKVSHKAVLEKARAEAESRLRYEEAQLAYAQDEAVHSQAQHAARVRRQHGLLRRFHLALRPQDYRRKEFLHYLSSTMGVPCGALRILSEAFVQEDLATHRDLASAPGEPLPEVEEPIDALVRELPELCLKAQQRGAAGSLPPPQDPDEAPQDALDAALAEARAADAEETAGHGQAVGGAGIAAGATSTVGAGGLGLSTMLGSTGAPTLPPGRVLRVEIELLPDRLRGAGGRAAELACTAAVRRLAERIRSGGSLLEDMAVLGMSSLRGGAAFDAEGAVWGKEGTELVKREARSLAGRNFVVTLYGAAEPMAVQLAAIDFERDEEYILCFDRADLRAFAGDDVTLSTELADALLDSLHFVDCAEDKKPALAALLIVAAPRTVVNAPEWAPEDGPAPFVLELAKALPALPAPPSLGAAPAAPKQPLPPPARAKEMSKRVAPPPHMKVVPLLPDPDERTCRFEDVILFEDRFFFIAISQDKVTGAVHVHLQEAGTNGSFEASLPGRPRPGKPYLRQLRAFTQAYEFQRLTLLLAIEDIPEPPALLVRIARGDSARPLAWCDPEQKAYWFSCEAADEAAGDALVEMIPSRHRERLLDFVHSELSRDIGQSTDPNGSNPGRAGQAEHEYGRENNRTTGLVLRDPHSRKPLDDAAAATAAAHLLEASALQGGRLLLKVGWRIPADIATSKLCVLTVREHMEPYLHFTISAFEAGTCSTWALVVDSLEVFRKLGTRTSAEVRDAGERRELARKLAKRCKLVNDGAGGLRLELGDTPPPRIADRHSSIAVPGSDGTGPRNETQGLQAMSQEEAAAYATDERRYCLVHAPLQMTDHKLDIRIFDEPDAPEAAFLINNFLIIAHDVARGLYFSLRLHDRALQHPLQPDLHLLEPENRTELLERILASLDLCNSVQQSGSSGERLVMQPMRIWKVPGLAPDATGVLRLLDPEVASTGGDLAKTGTLDSSQGAIAIATDVEGSEALEAGVPQSTLDSEEPSAAVHIGSCMLEDEDAAPPGSEGRLPLAQQQARLGDADVELALETDAKCHVHILIVKLLAETGEASQAAMEVQIPAWGEPTRVYLEHRTLAGRPLLVAMAQQAFPHEVQAMVFDPKTHEEISIVAKDDAVLPFVERSIRDRLSDALEQLAKFGTLGPNGSSQLCRTVASGRELFPSDPTVRALQNHVPVISVNFSKLAHQVPGDLVTSRELIFSCSRYVLEPSLLASINASEGNRPADLDLSSVPMLRLSLSKKTYCQDFTFFIELAGSNEASHMVNVRDKLAVRPLGVFGEIRKLGDLRLLVVFLDDCAPRALRIAVVEPSSGWSFQLIVADADAGDGNPPYLAAHVPRHELLQLFRRCYSARKGLPAMPAPTALLHLPAHAQAQQLKRETRFLRNDEAALITVSYEVPSEGELRLKATLTQATSAKETRLLLVNPGLDRVLKSCGLSPSAELDPEELMQEPAREAVATLVLKAIEVLPSLEMEFRTERLPKPQPRLEPPVGGSPPRTPQSAVGEGMQPPGGGNTAASLQPPVLECKEEELLAQASRPLTDASGAEGPGQGEANAVEAPHEVKDSGKDEQKVGFHVEVFDGSDNVQALFHSTNLRVRVTDVSSGDSAVRDVHEDDLEPWLAAAGAEHLLCASREVDLVDMILRHAALDAPAKGGSGARAVILEALRGEALTSNRFAASFLASVEERTE